jgi:hypothetical protein
MDQLTNLIGAGLFLTFCGWRIIRPYLFYRDVVSGATTCDAIGYILTQGFISAGIAIYFAANVGFRNFMNSAIILTFFLMAIVSLYFGAKAWVWNKNKKKVGPEH